MMVRQWDIPAVTKVKGHDISSVGEHIDVPQICSNCFNGNTDPRLQVSVLINLFKDN